MSAFEKWWIRNQPWNSDTKPAAQAAWNAALTRAAEICSVISTAPVGSSEWNRFDEVTAGELKRRIEAEQVGS